MLQQQNFLSTLPEELTTLKNTFSTLPLSFGINILLRALGSRTNLRQYA